MRTPQAIAYHEAGHTVVALELGLIVVEVMVHSGQTPGGHTETQRPSAEEKESDPEEIRAAALRDCIRGFAGSSAELKYSGDHHCLMYAWDDRDRIGIDSAAATSSGGDAARLRTQASIEATRLVNLPTVWSRIQRLAEALNERGSLTGREVESCLTEIPA